MNEVNAKPHTELIAELMNPNNPKNEREHAAVREIERLQEALAQRTWVGLNKEDIESWELPDTPTVAEFAWFVEANLKDKNCVG